MLKNLKDKVYYFLTHNLVSKLLRRVRISSLGNLSLWDLITLYGKGISQGLLSTRAAAVSWNLFFSLFPFLFFLFGILPELPFYNEVEEFFFQNIINDLLPSEISTEFSDTVSTILRKREEDETRRGVSWLSVALTLFLCSNGMYALLIGFSQSFHYQNIKSIVWKKRLLALVLPIVFATLIVGQLALIYYSKFLTPYFEQVEGVSTLSKSIAQYLSDFSALILYFISIFILYYFGGHGNQRLRHILPGVIVNTLLFTTLLFAFGFYIQNYNNYHLFYGSVGAIMVVMLFIYLNVTLILVGFELNVVLQTASNSEASDLSSKIKTLQ